MFEIWKQLLAVPETHSVYRVFMYEHTSTAGGVVLDMCRNEACAKYDSLNHSYAL